MNRYDSYLHYGLRSTTQNVIGSLYLHIIPSITEWVIGTDKWCRSTPVQIWLCPFWSQDVDTVWPLTKHCSYITTIGPLSPWSFSPKFELILGPTNAPHYFYIPSPGPPCSGGLLARDVPTPDNWSTGVLHAYQGFNLCIIWSPRGGVMSHATIDSRIQSYLVCRGLLGDCEILHRDKSPANILWHDPNSMVLHQCRLASSVIYQTLGMWYFPCVSWIQFSYMLASPDTSSLFLNHAEISKSTKHVRGGQSVSSVYICLILRVWQRPGQSLFYGSCNQERRPGNLIHSPIPLSCEEILHL